MAKITRFPEPAPDELPPGAPVLVTYEEAAQILGGPRRPVSVRHVENLVAAGELKRKGRNKARRILYSSILAYISKEAA